ncbi:hypothetical protein [Pedosphaera parvula]|uniref:Uncharacterized protein n=1 Tax=Pedosphaera parvula (strain Ellin514) TaxID=320771 RepID=B9XRX3_PEDPL|nr:hypothetical protein [Pedosphaera parvula]EEF57432.1 hypothetical protein Cflav_PD0277 [Pedosphaera parvula Ellin514]
MRRPKYFTNLPLWFLLSFILFIPGWFIPIFHAKGAEYLSAASIVSDLVRAFRFNPKIYLPLLMFFLLFAVPALSLGWVIQCLIVMARAKRLKS